MPHRFCPDCGADCQRDDDLCLECKFPLSIELKAEGSRLVIEGRNRDRWRRVSSLLMKNGMLINTQPGKDLASHQAWWIFPGVGLMILLVTLAFGQPLVSMIWPLPDTLPPVLDLTQDNPGGAAEAQDVPQQDIDFLSEAFKVSDDQLGDEFGADELQEFVDIPVLSYEEIKALGETAYLSIQLEDHQGAGVFLSDHGFLMTSSRHIEGAFKRKLSTIESQGELVQDYVVLVPEVGFLGQDLVKSQFVQESDRFALTMLEAPLGATPEYRLDFDTELAVGDEVWLVLSRAGRILPEKALIVRNWQNELGVVFHVPEGQFGPSFEGSPVFNLSGVLSGMMLFEGQDVILSLRQIRERAPFVYSYTLRR